jgi:hypothetical protein
MIARHMAICEKLKPILDRERARPEWSFQEFVTWENAFSLMLDGKAREYYYRRIIAEGNDETPPLDRMISMLKAHFENNEQQQVYLTMWREIFYRKQNTSISLLCRARYGASSPTTETLIPVFSACKIVFFDRPSAERFWNNHRHRFLIQGFPNFQGRLVWNKVKSAAIEGSQDQSRVLLISGPNQVVNEHFLTWFL